MAKLEGNFLENAYKVISEGLPKFFDETNTPFLGKDEEQSVMREKSQGQQQKELSENLISLAAGLIGAGKSGLADKVMSIAKSSPRLASATIAGATGDPTAILSGPVAMADAVSQVTGGGGAIKDADAMIVPASVVKDRSIIASAINALRGGADKKGVFNQFGVYEGPLDKKARAVISDKDVKLKDKNGLFLGDVLDHPELFKAQEYLKGIEVSHLTPEETAKGFKGMLIPATKNMPAEMKINPEASDDETVSTILHEVQHAIQERNGFVSGSNMARSVDHPAFGKMFNQVRVEKAATEPDLTRDDVMKIVNKEIYRRTAGEVEARATQRMKLFGDSIDERFYTQYPLDRSTYDVAPEEVLLPAP